jgi:signal transduction histidine kinase/ligand-binding sensor domain-containing protein
MKHHRESHSLYSRLVRRTGPATCALLSLFLGNTASALDPHRLISQYAHTVWRVQDGFPNGPHMITQTRDGYIWIAAHGLLRFDGVTITPIPSQKDFPTDKGINWLLGSSDGSLWMGTYHGLYRYKDGQGFTLPLKRGSAQAVLEDHAGAIWVTRARVGGVEGALCRFVGDDMNCYAKDKGDGNPASFATSLGEDASGNIWFGCQMLCRFDGSSVSNFIEEQIDHPSGDGVVGLAADASGSVWVAMDGVGPGLGVRHYSKGKFASYVVPGFDGETVRALTLLVDRDQTLWVGTDSQGLYHIHDGRADHYGAAQGLTGEQVNSLFQDREGNLWLTTDKGVDLFRDIAIVSSSSTEGLSGSEPSAVLAQSDNSIWVGLRGALAHIRPDNTSLITMADGRAIQDVYALFEDRAGEVWLGINRTVMVRKLGQFSAIKNLNGSRLEQIAKIFSFTEDIDGNIWAIGYDDPKHIIHLLRIKDHRVLEDIDIGSKLPFAHFLGADPAGGIWIGTVQGSLAHYQNGVVNRLDDAGKESSTGNMISFFVDPAGVAWGATAKGLYRWGHGTFSVMDSRNNLPCTGVTSALTDNAGSLWLDSACGYQRISAADLANWVAHPDVKVTATVLGALDGADPGWSADRIQPSAAKSADGRLWFVGLSALQMIDPGRSYKNALLPPVHVEGLFADGKNYSSTASPALPALSRDIRIDYTALSFVMPQRIGFRYRLEGRDVDWQDPGLRRQAFYNDLRPGSYRFRVIASNNDGVWNESGATLDFSVTAAWYQTIWFRSLCTVAGVLLLWAIYRFRMHRVAGVMRARFDERLAERTRIARDLHDTFLQTIQGSKLVADNALRTRADPPQMQQAMEKLSAWLGRATEEGRAALNSLRTSTIEVNDLAGAFQRALDECRIHNAMEVSLQVTGSTQEMHPIVRDEVYRIGYEAIRNACVHSHATRLRVELTYSQDLNLRVSDNGSGIDPNILNHGKPGHLGLINMRERASRILAKFSLISSVEQGTEIALIVPGGIMYRVMKA